MTSHNENVKPVFLCAKDMINNTILNVVQCIQDLKTEVLRP